MKVAILSPKIAPIAIVRYSHLFRSRCNIPVEPLATVPTKLRFHYHTGDGKSGDDGIGGTGAHSVVFLAVNDKNKNPEAEDLPRSREDQRK